MNKKVLLGLAMSAVMGVSVASADTFEIPLVQTSFMGSPYGYSVPNTGEVTAGSFEQGVLFNVAANLEVNPEATAGITITDNKGGQLVITPAEVSVIPNDVPGGGPDMVEDDVDPGMQLDAKVAIFFYPEFDNGTLSTDQGTTLTVTFAEGLFKLGEDVSEELVLTDWWSFGEFTPTVMTFEPRPGEVESLPGVIFTFNKEVTAGSQLPYFRSSSDYVRGILTIKDNVVTVSPTKTLTPGVWTLEMDDVLVVAGAPDYEAPVLRYTIPATGEDATPVSIWPAYGETVEGPVSQIVITYPCEITYGTKTKHDGALASANPKDNDGNHAQYHYTYEIVDGNKLVLTMDEPLEGNDFGGYISYFAIPGSIWGFGTELGEVIVVPTDRFAWNAVVVDLKFDVEVQESEELAISFEPEAGATMAQFGVCSFHFGPVENEEGGDIMPFALYDEEEETTLLEVTEDVAFKVTLNGEEVVSLSGDDYHISKYGVAYGDLGFWLDEPIMGVGTLEVTLVAGSVKYAGALVDEDVTVEYNLIEYKALDIESTTPEQGVVESLSEIEIVFNQDVEVLDEYSPLRLMDPQDWEWNNVKDCAYTIDGNVLTVTLPEELTEAGTWSLANLWDVIGGQGGIRYEGWEAPTWKIKGEGDLPYDLQPANGSVVRKLTTAVIFFDKNIVLTDESPRYVFNTEWEQAGMAALDAEENILTITFQVPICDEFGNPIDSTPGISEAGDYMLMIPTDLIVDEEGNEVLSEMLTINYTVDPTFLPYQMTPEDGSTITELSYWTLHIGEAEVYNPGIDFAYDGEEDGEEEGEEEEEVNEGAIELTDTFAINVALNGEVIKTITVDSPEIANYGLNSGEVGFSLDYEDAITGTGTLTVTIPAGSIKYDGKVLDREFVATYNLIEAVALEIVSVTPEAGSQVEELNTVVIEFNQPIGETPDAHWYTLEFMIENDWTYESNVEAYYTIDGNTITITASETISDNGVWTLSGLWDIVCGQGGVMYEGWDAPKWTIGEIDLGFVADPELGTKLEKLVTVNLTFDQPVQVVADNAKRYVFSDDSFAPFGKYMVLLTSEGPVVTCTFYTVEDDNWAEGISDNGYYNFYISDDTLVYEDGTYVFNNTVELYYTVDGNSETGIDAVVAADSNDVYTMSGVLVVKGGDAAAVKALQPGLYIINGKKVLVK